MNDQFGLLELGMIMFTGCGTTFLPPMKKIKKEPLICFPLQNVVCPNEHTLLTHVKIVRQNIHVDSILISRKKCD